MYCAGGGGEGLVVFNVSSVQPWEEVRRAELQLNRRRQTQRRPPPGRLLAPPLRVRLYRWSPSRLTSLASVPVAPVRRNGWVVVDITSPLKELLLDSHKTHHLLALKFESPTGKVIRPSHFLRGMPHTPYAFLVVSSEDSDENQVTEDGARPSPSPPIHTHAIVQQLQQGNHGSLFKEEEDNTLQIIPSFFNLKQSDHLERRNVLNATDQITSYFTPKVLKSYGTLNNNKLSSFKSKKLRLVRSIADNQLMGAKNDVVKTPQAKTSSSMSPKSFLMTSTTPLNYSDGSGKKTIRNKKNKRKKKKLMKDDYHDTLQNIYKVS